MAKSISRSPSTSPRASVAASIDSPAQEVTPLLSRQNSDSGTPAPRTLHHGRSAFFIWTIILGIVLAVTATNSLIQAPQQRIMESVFCKYYYQENDPSKIGLDGEVEEIWCKIPGVHKPMASLRGWFDALGSIPGVLVPIPYGILADRIGRWKILLLSVFGLFLEFSSLGIILFFHNTISIRFILLSPLFEFTGGASVAVATALTMVADSVSPEERAVVYFRISAGAMIGPLVAYPLAALLMGISPYLSILIALIISFISVLMVLPLPETLNLEEVRRLRAIAAESRPTLPSDTTLSQKMRAGFAHLVQSTRDLLHHQAVIWLLPMFLVAATLQIAMDFLLQYGSEKFQWSFKNASILPEIHMLVNALLLIFFLPALSHLLTRKGTMTSARKDLFLTRACVVLSIIGLFLIGAAPTMGLLIIAIIIYSMGGGFIPSTRALLVGLVRPEQNARLFAVCGTLTYLGSAITAPLIAKTYGWALGKGGVWLGAPFWLAGILVIGVSIPLFILRFKGDHEDPLALAAVLSRDSGALLDEEPLMLRDEEAEELRERERLGYS